MKNSKTAQLPAKDTKDATITIRISPEWESYIEQTAATLTKKMETEITKTWVVTQLMKLGLPHFEKKHGVKRVEKKAEKKPA